MSSQEQLADILTKPLPIPTFTLIRDQILGLKRGNSICKSPAQEQPPEAASTTTAIAQKANRPTRTLCSYPPCSQDQSSTSELSANTAADFHSTSPWNGAHSQSTATLCRSNGGATGNEQAFGSRGGVGSSDQRLWCFSVSRDTSVSSFCNRTMRTRFNLGFHARVILVFKFSGWSLLVEN